MDAHAHDPAQMTPGARLRKRIRRVFSMVLALALVVVVVRGIYVWQKVESESAQRQSSE